MRCGIARWIEHSTEASENETAKAEEQGAKILGPTRGVHQHCREKHLHRYLAEFGFRYNHRVALGFSEGERVAIKGIEGKRLTYQQPHQA